MDKYTEHQIRLFRPIIIFHNDSFPFSPSTRHQYQYEQASISSIDSMDDHVQIHKRRINDMLKVNSKIWSELMTSTRKWSPSTNGSSLPPIHLPPTPSSSAIDRPMYDEQPVISPTTSTSSSSTSSSSSSESSLSTSATSISSLPFATATSSMTPPPISTLSTSPSLSATQYHYQKHHYRQPSSVQPLPPTPTNVNTSVMSSKMIADHDNLDNNGSLSPLSLSQQHRYYQLHMDTLCLDQLDKRRRGNLPKPVTAILKKWLLEHCRNPYPTEEEKLQLKSETQLTLNQISNWFINARRRTLPVILAKLNHHYPGIKARRRRRRQRQDKTKCDNGPNNKKKVAGDQ